ncbi:MAG: phosphohydrolase, partial [Anaerolineae bacterium]
DTGKAAQPPLRLWERVLIVIGKALWEDALARWGDAPPKGWRRPFVIAAQHPLWGAQMAQQAGASPQVVALIREHQQPRPHPPETPFEHLLHHLQMADDAN